MDNPIKYGLRPNKHVVSKTKNAYIISFYHQVHFIDLSPNASHDRLGKRDLLGDSQRYHAEHCFSYIRQGMRCAADSTLEGPDLVPEPVQSGWGVYHQSRRWDSFLTWMDENSAT